MPKLRFLIAALFLAGPLHAQEPPAEPAPAEPAATAPPAAAVEVPLPATVPADTIPLVIEARGLKHAEPPLFFGARASTKTNLTATGWNSESTLDLSILQGKDKPLVLELLGKGTITSVTGAGIASWGVSQSPEGETVRRYLEIRPAADAPATLQAVIKARSEKLELPAEIRPLLLGAGKAVGFSSLIELRSDASVDLRVTDATGLVPGSKAEENPRLWQFQSFGAGSLSLSLRPGGAAPAEVELVDVMLAGTVDEDGRSASFVLTGQAKVRPEKGGSIAVLGGHAAVSALPVGGDFSIRLDPTAKGGPLYRLHFDSAGTFPVRFEFQAGLIDKGAQRMLDFRAPAGAVVPLQLSGLKADADFDPECAVFPTAQGEQWLGFLPANGHCQTAWGGSSTGDGEGKLFYASDAKVEVRVSAGLLRQTTNMTFSLLQGTLDGLNLSLQGDGEILSVEGGNVLAWSIEEVAAEGEAEATRRLVIQSAQPVTGSETITVRSQSPLGEFPLSVTPLRLTPDEAVRHSGYLRIASEGAVRLEPAEITGLTQLAPEQFPGGAIEGARQTSVYRFPSAQHSYQINADKILPEVSVSQILLYEMTDSDRVISGRIELDIREAPLREWQLQIPEDYAVVRAAGAAVADHVAAGEASEGQRNLKILFNQAVTGRQLIELRLEKNIAAAAGAWQLPPLTYPQVKSVRGHVGVVTTAGFRASSGAFEGLAEVPNAYFPIKAEGLQLTHRLRQAQWAMAVDIAALDQSVQADVLHLYSLKEGIAYGSVLLNYFVVGAPVGEWRLKVPQSAGNLAIEGENVQGWRREGEEIIVTLHQPILGGAKLLLTFEEAMNARGGQLTPGDIIPVGVQAERGHIQVVSPSQVRHTVEAISPSLLKIEPLELPANIRILSNSPTLAAYQYSVRPFELAMNIEWYEPGRTVDQLVDFAKLESQVAGDGQVVTNAGFWVRTRGQGTLRMRLPANANLWEAKVANAPVSARQDGDETLIPLPASLDPNTPVHVHLHYGQSASSARNVSISAPQLAAPTMIATWKITGDGNRRLVPTANSTPLLKREVRTESGFEWLRNRGGGLIITLLMLALIGAIMARASEPGSGAHAIAIVLLLVAILVSVVGAVRASSERRVNLAQLEFVAPVVSEGEQVAVELQNLPLWEAHLSNGGLIALLVGLGFGAAALFGKPSRRLLFAVIAFVLVAAGLLYQFGGAILLFILLAVFLYLFALHPALLAVFRHARKTRAENEAAERQRARAVEAERPTTPDDDGPPPPEGYSVSSVLLIGTLLLGSLFGSSRVQAAELAPSIAPDVLNQTLRLEDGRLYAEVDLQVTGRTSDTLLLLRAPAILTQFEGNGLRVSKRQVGDRIDYWLVLEKDGTHAAKACYEFALPDPKAGFDLPTARAAVQKIEVRHDKGGWEFRSPAAVKTTPLAGLPKDQSGATFILGPHGASRINLAPKSRDLSTEEARIHAEVTNLFIPAPGLVDGLHQIIVRPARGQISALECTIPAGFTVSDVSGEGLRNWRFDPESKSLALEFSAPVRKVTTLTVKTQQGIGSLPATTELEPVSVRGAASQLGSLALAFGKDAQPEASTPTGLSKVSLDDFDSSLIPVRDKQPIAALHEAFRYGADSGSLSITVGEVSPEVRVASQQTLSIGDERMVLAVDLAANITRAGLFQLSFAIPGSFEIEGLTGDSLSHWTDREEGEQRIVTLHLNGRTIGPQRFAITLAGPPPGASDEWQVPRFTMREATRQTGQILIVPEQGIRVRAVSRQHVSQLDARALSGGRPSTLAFGLLQADWQLALGVEKLETWITAQALQDVTLREGVTRTRIGVQYKVENAAVKSLQVRLPGLSESEQRTVRASGTGVSDIIKRDDGDAEDLWEIKFSRRIIGKVNVTIDYQRSADRSADNSESIRIAELVGVRQPAYWVALHGSGHLELAVADPPAGWQTVDASSIPAEVTSKEHNQVPGQTFRAVAPDGPLVVSVQRHAVAAALRLRVSQGEFLTTFSPRGAAITEARMIVQVAEKSPLEVRPPDGARLMSASVNDESVNVVQVDGSYRFHVLARDDSGRADVSLTWEVPGGGGAAQVNLRAPAFNVPLQNVRWNIVVPPGYQLSKANGNLELSPEQGYREYDFDHYWKSVRSRRDQLASAGEGNLQRGIEWRSKGKQGKALMELGKAARNSALAPSYNEDARVQLRELQREQVILGVNALQQKLYLDNASEASVKQNQKLEQAAQSNPLLQGKTDYDPNQVQNQLEGNSSESIDALGRIADRLVSQQLAAEPALRGINVAAEGAGAVHVFRRSVQVDGDDPLTLQLRLSPERKSPLFFGILVLLGLALLTAIVWPRRRNA